MIAAPLPDRKAAPRTLRTIGGELRTVRRLELCHSSFTTPHGEGHNAVCVCGCPWCLDERAVLGAPVGAQVEIEFATPS